MCCHRSWQNCGEIGFIASFPCHCLAVCGPGRYGSRGADSSFLATLHHKAKFQRKRAHHEDATAHVPVGDWACIRTIVLSSFCNRGHRGRGALGALGELGNHGPDRNCGYEVVVSSPESDSPVASSRWHILANPQDRHCVIFHITCLAAYACAFWLYRHPKVAGITGPWSRMAFVAASAL